MQLARFIQHCGKTFYDLHHYSDDMISFCTVHSLHIISVRNILLLVRLQCSSNLRFSGGWSGWQSRAPVSAEPSSLHNHRTRRSRDPGENFRHLHRKLYCLVHPYRTLHLRHRIVCAPCLLHQFPDARRSSPTLQNIQMRERDTIMSPVCARISEHASENRAKN